MADPKIKVLPDPDSVAREAAERIAGLASECIAAAGSFTIALCGGSTPKALYRLLAADPYKSRIQWPRVEVLFGDERCVPPDHPDSNFKMAYDVLLSKVPIPAEKVHRMRGEIDPQAAAKEYGQMLKERFGEDGGPDMILLGMGEDGHTASLFPGTDAVKETTHRVVANFAEHSTTGRSWRITMTAPFINRAGNVMVAVVGAAKAERLRQVLEGPHEPEKLPIQLIQPVSGRMTWLLDVAAAGMMAPQ